MNETGLIHVIQKRVNPEKGLHLYKSTIRFIQNVLSSVDSSTTLPPPKKHPSLYFHFSFYRTYNEKLKKKENKKKKEKEKAKKIQKEKSKKKISKRNPKKKEKQKKSQKN